MKFFAVQFVHYDSEGWKKYLEEHLAYLRVLEAQGTLRASGPQRGTPVRSGLLILSGESREAVIAAINNDPFVIHGLVNEMTITEWDPVFGVFAKESSGKVQA